MLSINRFVLTSTKKLMENFFQISNSFSNYVDRRRKNIQMNREAWILMKVQCVVYLYQWIRLNKLHKLMDFFFQISNYMPKNKNYSKG